MQCRSEQATLPLCWKVHTFDKRVNEELRDFRKYINMKSDEVAEGSFLPIGTAILQSKPFAYCVKSSLRDTVCDFCLKT